MSAPKRQPILLGEKLPKFQPVVVESQYQAGVCNIGPAEIARRRRAGHVGLALSVVLLAVLIVVHAPPIARLLVALTAAVAASGYIQARWHFCAAFGSRGVYNFGEVGPMTPIADKTARARDRVRAAEIGLASAAIGIGVGIVAVLLPL
jgi:hypothetical protein